MEEFIQAKMKNMSSEDMSNFLINMNKFILNRKEHIKKYNKIRNLHSDVVSSMCNYICDEKYSIDEYFNLVIKYVYKETNGLEFDLKTDKEDDINILYELFMYKNHEKIPSVTEIYLDKKKFRNEEKVKMLKSMKSSYVGLFKIVNVDKENGYLFYEDIFTRKKFKVIDIAMSSTLKVDKKVPAYVYNRVITYEDISFGTGIHCMFKGQNKALQEFIKTHKYYKCSDFSRCLLLYMLFKKESNLKITYNNQYGNRR